MKALLSIFLITAHLCAIAADSPVDAYSSQAESAVILCGLQVQAAAMGIQRSENDTPENCVTSNLADLKSKYLAAAKGLKKAAVKKALQEHFIASSEAIRGTLPEVDEIRMLYTQRQSINKAKMREMWQRFELAQ